MADSTVDFAVYFNSGMNSRSNTYTNGANITNIQLNNSDQSYYQDGMIELYDCSTQQVGDRVDVFINDSQQFSGYVSRRQINHKAGKQVYSYQLIGKTYDLWRYRTGKSAKYTGYTSYVASSLVHDYCQNMHGNSNLTDGVQITTELDISDQPVGDALVTLTGYDGFKFYVDETNTVIYYDPAAELEQTIVVEEEDIFDMSPVEEADEDIFNDVLVIGGNGYSYKSSVPLPTGKPISQVSSATFLSRNKMIAQKFKPKDDTLSAIRLFLGKTAEPNSPTQNVDIEIWDNNTSQIMNDSFDVMDNWSVTSNTKFDDGNLTLSYMGETIKYSTYDIDFGTKMFAQRFIPTVTTIVDSAIIPTKHSLGTDKTLWVEIRWYKTTTEKPGISSMCSGSVVISPNTYYTTPINLTPKKILNANTSYVVCSRLESPITDNISVKGNSTYAYYPNTDYFNMYSSIDGGMTWTSHGLARALNIEVDMHGYATSGYALTKPFGTPLRKVYDRYMKVDLNDIISSNLVVFSGSNSGSKNFDKLTNGEWHDFGFQNTFSSQVKIRLSGNGTYTPKVGSVVVTVSDTTGGAETTLFSDPMSNYTYLSGAVGHTVQPPYQNKIHIRGADGYLWMSGANAGYATVYWPNAPSSMSHGTRAITWNNSGNMVDADEWDTYADFDYNTNSEWAYYWSDNYTLNSYKDIDYIKMRVYEENKPSTPMNYYIFKIYLSGNWAGKGWIQAATPYYYFPLGTTTTKTFYFDNDMIFYNVKRIKISSVANIYADGSQASDLYNYGTCAGLVNSCRYSGTIQSKKYATGIPVYSMNIQPTDETYPNRITYSGSKNSGSTWYKLTKDTWTILGNGGASGQYIRVMYNMRPSTLAHTTIVSSTSLINSSPLLGKAVVKYTSFAGGDLPRSGTKIDSSDDIYISEADISYSPSHSSYKEYTSPKLKNDDGVSFNENNYYWLVLHSHTGTTATDASKYFTYYYDYNSTFADGEIAYSTGNSAIGLGVGTTWKNHSLNPTFVPDGDLIMDIGWKDDIVRATATNEQSINLYGRHQKIINDSTISSYEQALAVAEMAVSGMETLTRKGSITIDGVTNIKTNYKLSSNLANLGIGGEWEIVGYSQILDGQGFRTIVQYGKQAFDIVKRVAELEKKVL